MLQQKPHVELLLKLNKEERNLVKEHIKMPLVKGVHYPYTEAGKKRAKAAEKRQKAKKKKSKKKRY